MEGVRLGSECAHERVQLHVLVQDSLRDGSRAGVAGVQREQDLLLTSEVLDRLRVERVDVRARHGEPPLRPAVGSPEQAPRVRELVVMLLRQQDECSVCSLPSEPFSNGRSGWLSAVALDRDGLAE